MTERSWPQANQRRTARGSRRRGPRAGPPGPPRRSVTDAFDGTVFVHSPFIFPSLGPTAFHYFSRQTAPSASPRNAIIGHLIGSVAGYFSLVVTGLTTAGPSIASLACRSRFGVHLLRQPKASMVL